MIAPLPVIVHCVPFYLSGTTQHRLTMPNNLGGEQLMSSEEL